MGLSPVARHGQCDGSNRLPIILCILLDPATYYYSPNYLEGVLAAFCILYFFADPVSETIWKVGPLWFWPLPFIPGVLCFSASQSNKVLL